LKIYGMIMILVLKSLSSDQILYVRPNKEANFGI
jgi:hypothetical protein